MLVSLRLGFDGWFQSPSWTVSRCSFLFTLLYSSEWIVLFVKKVLQALANGSREFKFHIYMLTFDKLRRRGVEWVEGRSTDVLVQKRDF